MCSAGRSVGWVGEGGLLLFPQARSSREARGAAQEARQAVREARGAAQGCPLTGAENLAKKNKEGNDVAKHTKMHAFYVFLRVFAYFWLRFLCLYSKTVHNRAGWGLITSTGVVFVVLVVVLVVLGMVF